MHAKTRAKKVSAALDNTVVICDIDFVLKQTRSYGINQRRVKPASLTRCFLFLLAMQSKSAASRVNRKYFKVLLWPNPTMIVS